MEIKIGLYVGWEVSTGSRNYDSRQAKKQESDNDLEKTSTVGRLFA